MGPPPSTARAVTKEYRSDNRAKEYDFVWRGILDFPQMEGRVVID
jgi:hypothetical protein